MSHFSVAILAGGRATRFAGRDKSALVVDGRSILDRQLDELSPLADDVMLIGAADGAAQATVRSSNVQVRDVADIVPGSGPLGGVHAALTAARGPVVLIVACDMPYVTGVFAGYLLSLGGAAAIVVPRTADGYHPLCAVYSRECLEPAARLLAERRLALHGLFAEVPTRVVTEEEIRRFGCPSRLLANVNTPAEYAALEALHDHKR
jgi:molybdopterin-guanine dinucleotide biosynthesis protein A